MYKRQTLALSGCGAQQAGAAAIVNDTVISDQDVQTVSGQLNSISPDGQKMTASDALLILIVAPYVFAEAERLHKTASADDARKAVPGLADPSPATIEFLRMNDALSQLDQASRDSVLKKLGKAKITVNPRYGTFVANPPALNPSLPNWIKPSATSPAS